ncbi:ammonium transporter [Corynebacterium epidermidicanis]|uniref:Ammonium transporter n=2 Tax=Corynebacterium epidermidicanis TaxID=1050174 RepID=A0A0G3GV82_9CORY|nr:ammonium transporter [Corynebacterium epidermidicanis]AKK03443.1 ammonium transporter [Corynebacterium epidermidicanis]
MNAENLANIPWMLISTALVLFMTPALALFYGGMSRQKSVLNMMMMSFGSLGVVTVVYVLWGWSMSYGDQSVLGIFGNPFEYFGLRNTIGTADAPIMSSFGYPKVIEVGYQLTFAVIACALISGALADRVKFGTWLVFTGLWSTFVYFPLVHMVWGGGFLSEKAESLSGWMFGRDGEEAAVPPVDFAGGIAIHISAGTAALLLAICVGRRHTFLKTAHRPHNLPFVMLGAALLWFGWFGFNGGSAHSASWLAGLATLNTTCAAAAGILGWLLAEKLRDGHATSLGAASGIVAGLVSITPAAGVLNPVTSLVLGFIGGILAALGVALKFRFKFDDSLDVVGVHLVAGIWGTIGLALLADHIGLFMGGGWYGLKLLIVQIVVAAATMLYTGVLTAIIGWILEKVMGWRVDRAIEHGGIDAHVHGETAYDALGMEGK